MPSDLKVTSIIPASMSNCHLFLTKKTLWSPLASPKDKPHRTITSHQESPSPAGLYSPEGSIRLQQTYPWQFLPSAAMDLPPACLSSLSRTNGYRKGNGSISVEKLLWVCRHHRQVVVNAHHVWSTRSVSLQGGEKELREATWSRGAGWGRPTVLRVSSVYKQIFPPLSVQSHFYMWATVWFW